MTHCSTNTAYDNAIQLVSELPINYSSTVNNVTKYNQTQSTRRTQTLHAAMNFISRGKCAHFYSTYWYRTT